MGKGLHEVLGWQGPLTHRQYQAWNQWIEADLEQPSRSDLYAAQTATEVANLIPRRYGGDLAQISDKILKRQVGGPEESEGEYMTEDEEILFDAAVERSKAKWAKTAGKKGGNNGD